jgi:hypothetical protein
LAARGKAERRKLRTAERLREASILPNLYRRAKREASSEDVSFISEGEGCSVNVGVLCASSREILRPGEAVMQLRDASWPIKSATRECKFML